MPEDLDLAVLFLEAPGAYAQRTAEARTPCWPSPAVLATNNFRSRGITQSSGRLSQSIQQWRSTTAEEGLGGQHSGAKEQRQGGGAKVDGNLGGGAGTTSQKRRGSTAEAGGGEEGQRRRSRMGRGEAEAEAVAVAAGRSGA